MQMSRTCKKIYIYIYMFDMFLILLLLIVTRIASVSHAGGQSSSSSSMEVAPATGNEWRRLEEELSRAQVRPMGNSYPLQEGTIARAIQWVHTTRFDIVFVHICWCLYLSSNII